MKRDSQNSGQFAQNKGLNQPPQYVADHSLEYASLLDFAVSYRKVFSFSFTPLDNEMLGQSKQQYLSQLLTDCHTSFKRSLPIFNTIINMWVSILPNLASIRLNLKTFNGYKTVSYCSFFCTSLLKLAIYWAETFINLNKFYILQILISVLITTDVNI